MGQEECMGISGLCERWVSHGWHGLGKMLAVCKRCCAVQVKSLKMKRVGMMCGSA